MPWVVLAVAFAGVWTYAFYREDWRNPEPLWMVALAVGTGCLGFFAADRIEARLVPDLSVLEGSLRSRAAVAFLVSGPVEETVKLLGVLLIVRPWTHFDETVDGLVYGAAAGAGFALVENLAFMQGAPEVILARGPIATGAHVLFSMLWGGAIGFAGHMKARWRRVCLVGASLLLAAAAHGTFNLITFSAGRELTQWQGRLAQIILVLVCAVILRRTLRVALTLQPFRFRGERGGTPRKRP